MARLTAYAVDPRTYTRIAYLLLALPLGQIYFVVLVTGIALGLGLAVVTVGIPILIATFVLARWMAMGERRLVRLLLGVEIASPYRPLPRESRWERLKAFLRDPATWRDQIYLLLQFPLGILSFVVTAVLLGVGLGLLVAPAWYWAESDGIDLWLTQIDTLGEAFALVPAGALLLLVGLPALNGLGALYGRFAELLLGSDADPELTAQVSELRGSRARVIAAADAERQRLERDLHDGAQQRLVSLALTLRMAEQHGDAKDELVRKAGEEARLALEELRDLARGIHPAILTNRGLGAALEDLATRSSVPVTIESRPEGRLPQQVEAAAYFIVSESLVNVAKHAGAREAWVSASVEGGVLAVEVRDDGTGGVTQGSGSGLQGLEDRVGALDGVLAIESPEGAGTRVTARIPLAAADDPDARFSSGALPEAEAAARDARRAGRLKLRLSILGALTGLLVVIWFLTGSVSDWIVWPLLGLGLVAGLDAWLVAGNPTPRTGEAVRNRSLMLFAGVLGVVNLDVIGIWIASGESYFWPAWVMLGSALLIGLAALGGRIAPRLPRI
jgi:signal transduction histidine kinase